MTIDELRERIRLLLASAGQQKSATDALVRRINRCLMMFDDRLYDLESGEHVVVANTHSRDASVIADAAAQLLQSSNADAECILLLLPPAEFLASQINMPGLPPDAMRTSLKLQAMTQLPEYDRQLDLAVTSNGESGSASQVLAWWIPAFCTSELFNAFSAHSLFLAAVLPRPAWLLAGLQRNLGVRTITLQDTDRSMLTIVGSSPALMEEHRAATVTCLQTVAEDLLDPELNEYWQSELLHAGIKKIDYTINSADDCIRLIQQFNLQHIEHKSANWAAFPAPALAARHQLDRGRRRGFILKAIAAGIALLALPFIYQSWQLIRLDSQLADIRVLSADARQNQEAVREFETQWGVMTEFPDQDVAATMLELQQVINPGVLTMFEIDEGFITIEGESEDPQNVLERLEQNPLFTEVDFARATNNNRYFIDLRLTTVNFPAYQQWHFPESR